MIGSKLFEIHFRKFHFVSKFLISCDERVHKMIALGVFKYKQYRKIAGLFLFDFLPAYAYELTVKLKDYLAKKYYNAGDGFRGRRVLRNNGSVSFFLEKLSEKKTDSADHKI
ncbi:MAG: hypothetical protein WCK48_01565 [bacterium]